MPLTETHSMICIVCPNGCRLQVTKTGDELQVEGAQCNRGSAFALAELTQPMRSLSSTVATVFPDTPRLPVKTLAEIPKEQVWEAMRAIRAAKVTKRLRMGDVVLPGVCGTDIIATATMETKEEMRS